jgi:hypothetical protein
LIEHRSLRVIEVPELLIDDATVASYASSVVSGCTRARIQEVSRFMRDDNHALPR